MILMIKINHKYQSEIIMIIYKIYCLQINKITCIILI